jgi:DNA-directed RNA polymerase specialized sigma24 family protein
MNTITSDMSRERITAMLSDPELLKSVRITLLQRGVPENDVPDLIQQAFAEAFACKSFPESDADAKQYLFGIVRNQARMLRRKSSQQSKAGKPASFDETRHGARAAPIEERELLAKIVAAVPESRWRTFTWFARVTFGESLAEIAREEQVDYPVAHARFARIEKDLRKWAKEIAAGVVATLVALGVYRAVQPPPPVGHAPPIPSPLDGPTDEDRAEAAALRTQAADECRATHWLECQRDLDHAKLRDPDGDASPIVVDLRRQLDAAHRSLEDRAPSP